MDSGHPFKKIHSVRNKTVGPRHTKQADVHNNNINKKKMHKNTGNLWKLSQKNMAKFDSTKPTEYADIGTCDKIKNTITILA